MKYMNWLLLNIRLGFDVFFFGCAPFPFLSMYTEAYFMSTDLVHFTNRVAVIQCKDVRSQPPALCLMERPGLPNKCLPLHAVPWTPAFGRQRVGQIAQRHEMFALMQARQKDDTCSRCCLFFKVSKN